MPSINVTEEDFITLAAAANRAHKLRDHASAADLDKLARMVNAALANRSNAAHRRLGFGHMPSIKWTEVPSTIIG